MKYQAAYSMLFIGGNSSPTQAEVEKFMKDCGVSCDKKDLDQYFNILGGRSLTDLTNAGKDKLASMPSCGGTSVAPNIEAGPVPDVEKVDVIVEEKEDVHMGNLFGSDDEEDY